MTHPKQDDISRQRRLSTGRCPTHGVPVVQIGVVWEHGEPVAADVACPRSACTGHGRQAQNGGKITNWIEGQKT